MISWVLDLMIYMWLSNFSIHSRWIAATYIYIIYIVGGAVIYLSTTGALPGLQHFRINMCLVSISPEFKGVSQVMVWILESPWLF